MMFLKFSPSHLSLSKTVTQVPTTHVGEVRFIRNSMKKKKKQQKAPTKK